MASVTTYLIFTRDTEAAFNHYRSVFGTEFSMPMVRMKDAPPAPGQPACPAQDQNLVIHARLPILGGHVLMGSDCPASSGFTVNQGNNVQINLMPDTRAETERLFKALSEGGSVQSPLAEMFWGAYWGTCTDRFGVRWMFNCEARN